jgi:uncharacterized protein (TIGR02757 family)
MGGRTPSRREPAALKPRLDGLYDAYNRVDSAADPVHIVRRYADPADREVVGFLAAALAFGRVPSLLASIERVLARLGPHPAQVVQRFHPVRDRAMFAGVGHRWTRSRDLAALVWILQRMLDEAGSIERFFVQGHDPDAPDVGPALEAFATRARQVDLRPVYGRGVRSPGAHFFFPRPSSGSACKRLNLFLRWMVRRDAVDLGVWRTLSPATLVVPLDTHVVRVGRCLGLTRYRSPGWPMAVEITAALRQLDAADPVRYDFALCHLGMTGACGFGRPRGDRACPLRGWCAPHGGSERRRLTRSRPGGAPRPPRAAAGAGGGLRRRRASPGPCGRR